MGRNAQEEIDIVEAKLLERLHHLESVLNATDTDWSESGCGQCGIRYPTVGVRGTLCGIPVTARLYM